jgi:hypothetical protein
MQGKAASWGSKTVAGIIVGRNNAVVPPQEVEDLAALGCNNKEIAEWFGITEQTLRYNFSDFVLKGRERLKHSLRRAMLTNACVNMNAAVQIFLAKNMLSMSDSGMVSDASRVLPFTDDDDKPTAEQMDQLNEELTISDGTE